MSKPSLLERLKNGETIIGDGGFLIALEKRGYIKAGPWTPEVNVEHPEAVKQLHREFVRAGSDVLQAFTFYASEDKIQNRGNLIGKESLSCESINKAACKIAREVANEMASEIIQDKVADGKSVDRLVEQKNMKCLVAGGICQTPTYLNGPVRDKNGALQTKEEFKESVIAEFNKQLNVFADLDHEGHKVDFMICEYFEHIEEAVWAVEACRREPYNFTTVAATMCIGPDGDLHGNSSAECARQLAKSGANLVGMNCHFDPFVSLDCIRKMKKGLLEGGYRVSGMDLEEKKKYPGPYTNGAETVYLMCQPLGFMTPEKPIQGFIDLPEFPFALEPRICTRWEFARYAREAYALGVRYVGSCCGVEPYHVRAITEELHKLGVKERPLAGAKWIPNAGGLEMHTKPWVRARANKEYWDSINPSTGRIFSGAMSKPDAWEVTQGDEILRQKHRSKTDTTKESELKEVREIKKKIDAKRKMNPQLREAYKYVKSLN